MIHRFFTTLVFCSNAFALFAQNVYPQWGSLQPGPFQVGYKTIRATDFTRNYFPDAAGRPVQIYMWYPAQATDAKPMQYGGYFDDIGYDWGKPEEAEKLSTYLIREFKGGALRQALRAELEEAAWQKIVQTPVFAVRNAPAAVGKFPLLLHQHSNGAMAQSPMLEFLASHGYVVMSVSMLGTAPAFYGRGENTANALLTMTEDWAFVLAQAKTEAFADLDKVAAIGMVAQAGLSLQFKEMSLRAIACLDCVWEPELQKKMPFFDPKKIRIPILELVNTEYNDQKITFLDSLPFAERYIGRFSTFSHGNFYPFSKIARPDDPEAHKNYDFAANYALNFLNAVLKKDEAACRFLAGDPEKNGATPGFLTMRRTAAQKPPPTESELLTWLRYGQMDKVREAWANGGKSAIGKRSFWSTCMFLNRDRAPHTDEAIALYLDAYPADPQITNLLNQRGYDLLESGQTEEALKIFELFIRHFPESPYACDGLADVQIARGEREKAKANSEKVLVLLEKSNVSPAGKAALKKSAEDKLMVQPAPRHNEKISYDKATKRLLLTGGSEQRPGGWIAPPNCFEWDGSSWKEYTVPGPNARRGQGLVYCEKEKATLLIGGVEDSAEVEITRLDVWRWKDGNWDRVNTSSPVKQCEAVYDPFQDRVLVYGDGHDLSKTWRGGMKQAFELWEFKSNKWKKLSAEGPQVPHKIAFDTRRRAVVVPDWAEGKAVVWEWIKGQWKKTVCTGDFPEERSRFALAYCEKEGVVYLFGGRNNARSFLNDLWKWDGVQWTKVHTGSGPVKRAAALMEYVNGHLLLYGGTILLPNGKAGLSNEIWILENGRWQKKAGGWSKL